MTIEQFREQLCEFIQREGKSKSAIAREAGVTQSQLSNWSNGKGVRFTEKAKQVLDYIEKCNREKEGEIPEFIRNTLNRIADGDEHRYKVIANVLCALEPILKKDSPF